MKEINKNHIHTFSHQGGGCGVSDMTGYGCDDDYKCYCGAKIKIYSTQEVHFTMPRHISARKASTITKIDLPEGFDEGKEPPQHE